ncbi:putative glycosidase C21B10.07 [Grifola frondosa]|uniref:Putative glycosidase C21B10.07 n=1 Tax=Grifola frondosa TaxID=5627 RepID=A0A1C7M2R8_GRIFR|nr:putative glycosidase C21B10.07 [Grifola frondosa]
MTRFNMRTGYVILFLGSILIPFASAHFVLNDTYIGRAFFQGWKWETLDDPTRGRVNYIDQGTAIRQNLSYATDDKFVMRADDYSVVSQSARGRNSVRISSYKAYDESIIVLDLQHMPEGCSTWPAFWSLSQKGPWPHGGEIDIVEGVNLATQNLASLHTTPSCTMPQQRERLQSGHTTSTNCDASVNYNQGCGVSFAKPASYGVPFNEVGGGYFAILRTQKGVSIWFWSRNDPAVPSEIKCPSGLLGDLTPPSIFPTPQWGQPEANFPTGSQCDYDSHFDSHMLMFDLTFCGDWAGADYDSSGCGGTCMDLVNNHPQAFSNAYWEINSLRIYTPV